MQRILLICLLSSSHVSAMFIMPSEQTATYDAETAWRVASAANQSIEPYQAERDFAAVAQIIKEYAKFLIHHQRLERLLSLLQQVSVPTISVYRVDGVTVGFVNIVVLEKTFLWYSHKYVVIAGIGVDTAYQGKGYGAILLDYAIAVSKERVKATSIELEVHRDNKKALALYQSKGFVVTSSGADLWLTCVLQLVTRKDEGETGAVGFDNIVECFAC